MSLSVYHTVLNKWSHTNKVAPGGHFFFLITKLSNQSKDVFHMRPALRCIATINSLWPNSDPGSCSSEDVVLGGVGGYTEKTEQVLKLININNSLPMSKSVAFLCMVKSQKGQREKKVLKCIAVYWWSNAPWNKTLGKFVTINPTSAKKMSLMLPLLLTGIEAFT